MAVLTNREVTAVGSPIHSVRIRQFDHDADGTHLSHVITDGGRLPLAPYPLDADIVVNCTLQDTAAPLTYLQTEDLALFSQGASSSTFRATRAWGSAGFLRLMLEGPAAWDTDETLRHAIEIREGRVVNPSILAFQGRAADPPYAVRETVRRSLSPR